MDVESNLKFTMHLLAYIAGVILLIVTLPVWIIPYFINLLCDF